MNGITSAALAAAHHVTGGHVHAIVTTKEAEFAILIVGAVVFGAIYKRLPDGKKSSRKKAGHRQGEQQSAQQAPWPGYGYGQPQSARRGRR